MQNAESHDVVTLENQITECYGLLISQTQLAELLGRTTGGLRYSLSYPSDQSTRALKACGRKIGRRVYYPATEVARIIIGTSDDRSFLQRCTEVMSIAARDWALRQVLKPVPKFVLVVLADTANDQGVCWPRVSTIARKVGVSSRTVQRAIQLLIRHELITAEQRYRNDGSSSSNLYRLLMVGGDRLSPAPDCGDTAPDTRVIPGTTIGTIREPPQTPASEINTADRGGGAASDLVYPKDLLPAERAEAEAMLAALQAPFNQQVLDEWAGIMAAGAIRASPLGCLRALVTRAQAGTFTPERALRVAQARKARERAEVVQAQIELPAPGPIDEDNPLVQRLMTIARRKCARWPVVS